MASQSFSYWLKNCFNRLESQYVHRTIKVQSTFKPDSFVDCHYP